MVGRKPKVEILNGNGKGKAPMVAELSSPPLPFERHNVKPELPRSSKGKRLQKDKCFIVRRSSRLRSLVRPVQSRAIEPVIEEINLIESEEEDEPYIEERTHEPKRDEKTLEEKVDYLIQIVEELRSKGMERQFTKESTSDDPGYKSLYLDLLKKIEPLNSELNQCNKKLEFALGKLEAYETVKDLIEKVKEVMLISNLVKAAESVVNLSTQLISSRGGGGQAEQDIGAPQTMATLSPTKKKKRSNNDLN